MVVVAALLQLCQHILLVFRNTVHRGDWRQSNLKGPWALAFRLSMPISTHPIDVLLSPNPRGRALGQTPYSRSAFLRPYIRRPSLDCAPIDAPIVVNGYSLRVLIPSSRVSNLSLTPREAAAKILARGWRKRAHVQHRIQQGHPVRMPSRCRRQRWQGGADSHSDLFGPPIRPHSPIGKATVMVVTYDSATISCHLYGDIKSYVIIYLRKQRAI